MGEVVLGVIYWPSLRKKKKKKSESYGFLVITNDRLIPPADGDKYEDPQLHEAEGPWNTQSQM